jgi:hypothetical protein
MNLLNCAEFTALIRKQQEWLQEQVLAVEANKIEQDFQALKLAYPNCGSHILCL